MIVVRRFEFQAAHSLPRHPGKCRDLHGHSYRLEVHCEGPVDAASGMVMDFSEVRDAVKRCVLEPLDHTLLNDRLENPTAENLAVWIWDRLVEDGLPLVELRVQETTDCLVIYRGEGRRGA